MIDILHQLWDTVPRNIPLKEMERRMKELAAYFGIEEKEVNKFLFAGIK